MSKITKNLSWSEVVASVKATELGIDNTLPDQYRANAENLAVNLIQPICDRTGWRVKVNSWYRCPRLNKEVGGVATSHHLIAAAGDCMFYKVNEAGEFVEWVASIDVIRELKAMNPSFDQAIAYNTFVHLSYISAAKNRKMYLKNKGYNGVWEN